MMCIHSAGRLAACQSWSTRSKKLLVSAAFVGLPACGSSSPAGPTKSFEVILTAKSDDGDPIAEVTFSNGNKALGTTNASGKVVTSVQASEGLVLPVTTICPTGYIAPSEPTKLRLAEVRRVDPSSPVALGVDVTCTRKTRDIVFAVRAIRGASLPIEVVGQMVGTTDVNGSALFSMPIDRDVRKLSVSLNTGGAPRLRPQNPSRMFELDGQDAVLLYEQNFMEERPKISVRKAPPKKKELEPEKKHVPERIESGSRHAL
ncbi:MAG TPA: hypothetical protein VIV60_31200 [Polyangiaceae bacterium]